MEKKLHREEKIRQTVETYKPNSRKNNQADKKSRVCPSKKIEAN